MISHLKRNVGIGVLLGVAVAIAGFFLLDPLVRRNDAAHYRLTARFEVDGKPVSVSQVYGYSCTLQTPQSIESAGPCNLRGEAMRASLGSHGQVFFLMNAWAPDDKAMAQKTLAGHDTLVHGLLAAQMQRQPVGVKAMPVMVHFKDINDPNTVEAIDPADLETALGAGVVLKSVTVTSSNQATQYGLLADGLPWLSGLKGDRLVRDGDQGALAYRLHGFDFVWGG